MICNVHFSQLMLGRRMSASWNEPGAGRSVCTGQIPSASTGGFGFGSIIAETEKGPRGVSRVVVSGVLRQLVLRIHRERHAVMARMEDRFSANLDVKHVAATRLADRVGGCARIVRSAATGSELLRIADFVLDRQSFSLRRMK